MKILITGGAGFIGCNLAVHYRDLGHEVIIFDNFSRPSSQHFDMENIEVIKGSVCNIRCFPNWDFDVIIHAAAICGISSVNNPVKVLDVNYTGTKNVIDFYKHQCDQFIYLSTCEVEGLSPKSYQYGLFEPRWSYAISKAAAEYYCMYSGIPYTIIRPANIYGDGQTGESAMTNFIKAGLTDRKFTVYGDGQQIRSWCYISDFVDAINAPELNKTFTVGNPYNSATTYQLIHMICRELDITPEIIYVDPPFTDIQLRTVNPNDLPYGFDPKVTLTEGIHRTIKWHINAKIGL